MATTDLKLDEPGSLPKPGPVGRLVRLALGTLCLWYVFGLIQVSSSLITNDGHVRSVVWNGILVGLFLVSYVINIGYSRAWKKWPAFVSAGVFLLIGGIGYLTEGTVETRLLARAVWGWELYLFSHLGAAFVLSALLATPGCEMRAFHDLYFKLTGVPSKEHYCHMPMPAPASRYAHDSAMTAKSAVMTTTRSRLITASSVASTATVTCQAMP